MDVKTFWCINTYKDNRCWDKHIIGLKVFTKFFRAENEETRSQKGTGLGLYIVAKLITIQNGTIACMDNEPKGTDFQIKM